MKKLTVEAGVNSYPVYIEKGILNNIKDYLDDKRYFLITNETIYDIYKDFADNFSNKIIIPDGEEYKNIDTFKFITDKLLNARIERSDAIIAFGGGVVGDLAGFCASSVLRGISYIQIPTTLLSQVDSSVGGKTGFNHPMGKNLIGAFYQPSAVLIDPDTLSTLDEKQIKTGLGEVVKYAFIEKNTQCSDYFDLFNLLKANNSSAIKEIWDKIIYICISMKASVVSKDEKEKGLRSILNFGHTFGHAVEKITGYKKYTHGEAVAMGMIMAFNLALKRNFINENQYDEAKNLIYKYNLIADSAKGFNKEDILEAMKSDKKVSHSKIKLVLPVEIGSVSLFDDSSETLIKDSVL